MVSGYTGVELEHTIVTHRQSIWRSDAEYHGCEDVLVARNQEQRCICGVRDVCLLVAEERRDVPALDFGGLVAGELQHEGDKYLAEERCKDFTGDETGGGPFGAQNGVWTAPSHEYRNGQDQQKVDEQELIKGQRPSQISNKSWLTWKSPKLDPDLYSMLTDVN